MDSAKKSVLITGANGFVGSRLCRKFLDNGFHVIAGVRKTADLSLIKHLEVEYRYGDVTAPDTLPAMVAGVDYVVHNAGVVKAKRAQTFFDVNQTGTRNLLEATLTHNPDVKQVVYVSSLAGAGPSLDGRPVTEDDQPHPVSVYGRSKIAGERVAASFADRLPVVSVRPPGVYGPGDKEILAFFQAVHNRIRPCIGNQQRKLQLVHVDDLCEGIFRASTADTKSGSVYFIAEKQSYTMNELVGLLQEAIGRKGFPLWVPGPAFHVIAFCSEMLFKLVGATPMLTREKARELLGSWEVSTEKAKAEIGYESAIGFAEGARETYQWYRKEGWL